MVVLVNETPQALNSLLRVLLLSKLKKKTIFKYLKKNYFIYNYNFFYTLLTMF